MKNYKILFALRSLYGQFTSNNTLTVGCVREYSWRDRQTLHAGFAKGMHSNECTTGQASWISAHSVEVLPLRIWAEPFPLHSVCVNPSAALP